MTKKNIHIDLSKVDADSKAFFSRGTFAWEKSEAAIWVELENKIQDRPTVRRVNFRVVAYAAVAVILLLFGITSFMRLYTETIETPSGKHLLAELPDGSTLNMNAETTVKFKPYWWRFKRSVNFEGEAIFEVKKGSTFSVHSSNGTTEVLGTSFNVYSREHVYKVVCLTGKVKVVSNQNMEVVLLPNYKAEIKPNGIIEVKKNIETFPEISWRDKIFLFTASPVREVFEEIGRQYGITIDLDIEDYSLYTGNFTRDQNVEDILGYVCPAMGLAYKRIGNSQYRIYELSE